MIGSGQEPGEPEGGALNSTSVQAVATRRRFRRALRKWYVTHGRLLPWRTSADPYRIWISEIMLQQTTVAAVIPHFERFVSSFPDLAALAMAQQSDVLRAWEGLGYYTRARNLHKAARMIIEDFAGQFPPDVTRLQTLPGVGRYTAGAIASFAFQIPAPIVEANTARLYARLLGLRDPVQSTAGQRALWGFAQKLSTTTDSRGDHAAFSPADFNQALMDLGATVCRPVQPDCRHCPVSRFCKAWNEGLQDQIPTAKPRPEFTRLFEVAVAIRKGDRWLLRQCGDGERWAGLWDFVRFGVDESDFNQPGFPDPISVRPRAHKHLTPASRTTQQSQRQRSHQRQRPEGDVTRPVPPLQLPLVWHQRIAELTEIQGVSLDNPQFAAWIRHTVTRYHIQLLCVRATLHTGRLPRTSSCRWFTGQQLHSLPLSTTGRRFAHLLSNSGSRQ